MASACYGGGFAAGGAFAPSAQHHVTGRICRSTAAASGGLSGESTVGESPAAITAYGLCAPSAFALVSAANACGSARVKTTAAAGFCLPPRNRLEGNASA